MRNPESIRASGAGGDRAVATNWYTSEPAEHWVGSDDLHRVRRRAGCPRWLESLVWTVKHGPEIAPGEQAAERDNYSQVILTDRLRQALARLNLALPPEALDEAFRKLTRSARELVATVRANVTIDWTVRENVRAHLRVLVERILRKHGYPPDKQEKATQTVLEQAEVLSQEWAAA